MSCEENLEALYELEEVLNDKLNDAIECRDFKKCVAIVETHKDKDLQRVSLEYALFDACYYSEDDTAIFLIENGVEISEECVREIGYNGNVKIAQSIIQHLSMHKLYRARNDQFMTKSELLGCMLQNTFLNSMNKVAKLCIEHGASKSDLDDCLYSAYQFSGMQDVCKMLLKYGAKNVDYDLLHACRTNNFQAAQCALVNGAKEFEFCFKDACEHEHWKLAELLLPYISNTENLYFYVKFTKTQKYYSTLELNRHKDGIFLKKTLWKHEIQYLLNHGYPWKFKHENKHLVRKLTNQRHIRMWCTSHVIDDLTKDNKITYWDCNLMKIIKDYIAY